MRRRRIKRKVFWKRRINWLWNDYNYYFFDKLFWWDTKKKFDNSGIECENSRRATWDRLKKKYFNRQEVVPWRKIKKESYIRSLLQRPMVRAWDRYLQPCENRLLYMSFSTYPYYKYMPIYNDEKNYIYFFNKNAWESPNFNRKLLARAYIYVDVSKIEEIRFINSYNSVPNQFNYNFYNQGIINDDYIRFLKKYNIIGENSVNIEIPCWHFKFEEMKRNVNMDENFFCTDKKQIADKIVRIGTWKYI